MKLLNSPLQISDADIQLIIDLIDTYGDESGAQLCARMEELFNDDLTPTHYIVFGFFVGEREATKTAPEFLYNQISNLCQRQN